MHVKQANGKRLGDFIQNEFADSLFGPFQGMWKLNLIRSTTTPSRKIVAFPKCLNRLPDMVRVLDLLNQGGTAKK